MKIRFDKEDIVTQTFIQSACSLRKDDLKMCADKFNVSYDCIVKEITTAVCIDGMDLPHFCETVKMFIEAVKHDECEKTLSDTIQKGLLYATVMPISMMRASL